MNILKKSLLSMTLALSLVVAGCASNTETEESSVQVEESLEVTSESSESEPVESSKPELGESESARESESNDTTMTPAEERELNLAVVEAILKESLGQVTDVAYDSATNSFMLLPVDQQFIYELEATIVGTMSQDAWDNLVYELTELSVAISEATEDPSVSMILLNPYDTERALLIVQNGTVIYNMMNENGGF